MATNLHRGRKRAPVAEINMIPLIDVSLVLLIIFMVITPIMVQQQIRINLPKSVTGTEGADRPIRVMVQKDGGLSLEGRAVSASLLESEMDRLVRADSTRPVVIEADKNIPLQQIVSIMDVARRLRVARLGISVESPK